VIGRLAAVRPTGNTGALATAATMVAARPALPSMSKRPITPVPQRGTTDSRAPARLELSSGSKELQRESCSLSSRMKFRQVGKRRRQPSDASPGWARSTCEPNGGSSSPTPRGRGSRSGAGAVGCWRRAERTALTCLS